MTSTVNSFVKQSWAGLRAMVVLTILLGVLYPAFVWGVGQVVARDQAAGSLSTDDGTVIGSSLIGQQWTGDQWFWGRPSASDYSGDTSGGSNLSGTALDEKVAERSAAAGHNPAAAPSDALTASASGLDPHISPSDAESQIPRVAHARGLPEAEVAALVADHVEGRVAGFLGQPRVNVLELNLALAQRSTPAAG